MDISELLDHLDQIGQGIAVLLGLPKGVEVPYAIDHPVGGTAAIRLPAPGADKLDYLPLSKTGDIIGQGESPPEALQNALLNYRAAAAQVKVVRGNSLGADGRMILH